MRTSAGVVGKVGGIPKSSALRMKDPVWLNGRFCVLESGGGIDLNGLATSGWALTKGANSTSMASKAGLAAVLDLTFGGMAWIGQLGLFVLDQLTFDIKDSV